MWRFLLSLLLLCGCLRQDVLPVDPVNPPTPVVDPVTPPAPIEPGSLKVLILYESSEKHLLPPSQLNALHSLNVVEWLESHQADYRIWDQHADTSHAEPFWQQAIKLPHGPLPWIWITGPGIKGVNGPYPTTDAEVVQLLERSTGRRESP